MPANRLVNTPATPGTSMSSSAILQLLKSINPDFGRTEADLLNSVGISSEIDLLRLRSAERWEIFFRSGLLNRAVRAGLVGPFQLRDAISRWLETQIITGTP